MRTFTNEEIAKIQEVREIIGSICDTTSCRPCPLSTWDGCMEKDVLKLLDNIICCAEKNKGGN